MSEQSVHVVRIGYRLGRDPHHHALRIGSSSMGATHFHVFGDEDNKLFSSIEQVNQRFGGVMECHHQKGLNRWLKNFQANENKGVVVHLTMYGEDYKDVIPNIDQNSPLAIVVGGAKVPGEVFKISNLNVSIGTQPHSEVAALALFLEELNSARNFSPSFENSKMIIEPSADGKIVHMADDFEEE